MPIFVKGKGFFESMGWAGITFTNDIDKAFLCPNKNSANDICSALDDNDFYYILKVLD